MIKGIVIGGLVLIVVVFAWALCKVGSECDRRD